MRTTLIITDDLFKLAKKTAAEKGISLRKIVEDSLRQALIHSKREGKGFKYRLKIPIVTGKLLPGVDISDRDRLYDAMENRD